LHASSELCVVPCAGASASAGLPTATDILWDLKRQLYCRQENQEITRQDMQSEPVRSRIQAYVESKGFPAPWADDEYSACFERLFGDDRERQRRYLKAKLADDNAKLTVGSRALGGMIAAGMCRAPFTTNFDGLVERAAAEVAGHSLTAFPALSGLKVDLIHAFTSVREVRESMPCYARAVCGSGLREPSEIHCAAFKPAASTFTSFIGRCRTPT
jgi:hypothetical protein